MAKKTREEEWLMDNIKSMYEHIVSNWDEITNSHSDAKQILKDLWEHTSGILNGRLTLEDDS